MSLSSDKFYSVYGQTIRTREDFDGLLPRSTEITTLHYVVERSELPPVWEQAEVIHPSSSILLDSPTQITIWQEGTQFRIHFSEISTCDLTTTSIVCYPDKEALPEELRINFLGGLFSFWLEMHGVLALHASAVEKDGRAIGFLSHSGNGKSTLAAAVVQVGHPLLTDDILAVKVRGSASVALPGYPRMRMWQDEAQYFLGHFEDLEPVLPGLQKRWIPISPDGFGAFCDEPQSLACLYLLERKSPDEAGTDIKFDRVSPRDAIIELIRYSFAAPIVEAMGMQRLRMESFAQMAQQIYMRRVTFPSGLQHLPRVRDAILRDWDILGRH